MMNTAFYDSSVGRIYISEENGNIVYIDFEKRPTENSENSPVLAEAVKQLSEYFAGERKAFDLPLEFRGTDFQKKVWNELIKIPFGQTKNYGEIAAVIGRPKASRAVGAACGRNNIIIVVPCHRVIGKNGKLTGFACGLDIKAKLLEHEGIKY